MSLEISKENINGSIKKTREEKKIERKRELTRTEGDRPTWKTHGGVLDVSAGDSMVLGHRRHEVRSSRAEVRWVRRKHGMVGLPGEGDWSLVEVHARRLGRMRIGRWWISVRHRDGTDPAMLNSTGCQICWI